MVGGWRRGATRGSRAKRVYCEQNGGGTSTLCSRLQAAPRVFQGGERAVPRHRGRRHAQNAPAEVESRMRKPIARCTPQAVAEGLGVGWSERRRAAASTSCLERTY